MLEDVVRYSKTMMRVERSQGVEQDHPPNGGTGRDFDIRFTAEKTQSKQPKHIL